MSRNLYIQYLQNLLANSAIPYLSQLEYESAALKAEKPNISQKIPQVSQIQPSENQNSMSKCKLDHNMTAELSGKLVERYSRQMLLKQIAYSGQIKIVKSKVAVIGCGGIGCPLSLYLAGAGVGCIGLFDSDSVDLTNLHRQIGHKNASIGTKKTESLKNTLLALNPNIKIKEHHFVTVESCNQLLEYDLIIDGSDNPECRYIVNDFCMKSKKKLLSGACIGWEGQITCYGGEQSPCYRCIWGNEQKTTGGCSTLGVVGMLPGFVGIILAIEAIKIILNGISSLQGNLLTYESKTATFRKCKLRPRVKNCIGCGEIKLDMRQYEYQIHAICKPNLSNLPEVSEIEWDVLLRENADKKIMDVRPANQFNICHLKNMVNIPFEKLAQFSADDLIRELKILGLLDDEKNEKSIVYVSCNRGVMSKKACSLLMTFGLNPFSVKGGITEYANTVDTNIPLL